MALLCLRKHLYGQVRYTFFSQDTQFFRFNNCIMGGSQSVDTGGTTGNTYSATANGVTFRVNNVQPERASTKLPKNPCWTPRIFESMAPPVDPRDLIHPEKTERSKACQPILICPDAATEHPDMLKEQAHGHGFVSAISTAFNLHLPLSLRPETFWVLVLQGVSRHVNAHSVELRKRFVTHADKMTLTINRDEWEGRIGQAGLDWEGVVSDFSDQIDKNTVAEVAEILSTRFSSTTAVEATVAKVTVMDMLQEFFDYRLETCCGFPSITLEGTADDWRDLREKSLTLVRDKCTEELSAQWLPALQSVLDRFVAQVENPAKVDVKFWQSMCKIGGITGSGGYTYLNGWFNVFLPYLKAGNKNFYCVPYRSGKGYAAEPLKKNYYDAFGRKNREPKGVRGPDPADIPSGMASAPVSWDYLGVTLPLSFRAGFVGASQRSDGTIVPELGWCVVQESAQEVDANTT